MRPELVGVLVDAAIPCLGGIVATLIGFRVLGKKPGTDLKYDEWHRRNGRTFKTLGPLLIVLGLFYGGYGYLKNANRAGKASQQNWSRSTTSDGACSAEFPGEPTPNVLALPSGDAHQLGLSLPAPDLFLTLSYSDTPANLPGLSDDELLDGIRDSMMVATAQTGAKFTLVAERKVVENGIRVREIEFTLGETHTSLMRFFLVRNRIYRVSVVLPRGRNNDEVVSRFLASFRFEKRAR